MPDLVGDADNLVPARDERRVMLGHRREGAAVDPDAARVAEMRVRGEEDQPTSDCRSPSTEIAWPETVRPSGEAKGGGRKEYLGGDLGRLQESFDRALPQREPELLLGRDAALLRLGVEDT